jgi:Tol biopolymer transport system component
MLSIVDVSSGTATPFTAPVGTSEFDVTLDGSMIAYSDLDENGNLQGFVMDADGSNARQLTHGKGDGGFRGPSWSPDGSMIAYERDTSDNSQIFVVRSPTVNRPGHERAPLGWRGPPGVGAGRRIDIF